MALGIPCLKRLSAIEMPIDIARYVLIKIITIYAQKQPINIQIHIAKETT